MKLGDELDVNLFSFTVEIEIVSTDYLTISKM